MRVVQVVVEPVDDDPPYNQGLQGQWVAEPAEFPGLGVGEGVNAEHRKLIALVDVTPGMNTKQLAAAIGKRHSAVERYLKTLCENRLIEFRGAPKDGGYYLL
jgi:Transcriptional regulators